MARVLGRRVGRAWQVLRTMGPAEFAHRLVNRARLALGVDTVGQRAWLRHKAATDEAFDRARGVDTGGVQHIYDLAVTGPNAAHGTSHIASDPREFAAAMADALAVVGDPAAATFVDFGSGKGRALMLAAEHPFARIVGVEFAGELHAAAEANLAGRADRGRFALVHGDATAFDLPAGPLVLFLFNPFGAPVVARVAARAIAAWRGDPRPVAVLYVNPLHGEAWTRAGWREARRGATHALFVPG